MKRLVYYANGGSGNHGCEAIIRSLETILMPIKKSVNLSIGQAEDYKYELDKFVTLHDVKNGNLKSFDFIKSFFELKVLNNKHALDLFPYKRILRDIDDKEDSLALSIGGDNYCYGATDFYYKLNKLIRSFGFKTAMIGCSIEPEAITNQVIEDLENHEIIIARESITYKALIEAGLTNVKLLPDPAFRLNVKKIQLPINFVEGNTVGINISPMVISYGMGGDILIRNVFRMVEYILDKTDMNIALIPHVIWSVSDDREVLKIMYDKYADTNRICLIDDCNAEELKGYISRCRFLVTARTHASIAGYSSNVPTLVIGYSVKANGIAKDIFGTAQNYVIPTQKITTDDDLEKSFCWLLNNEKDIQSHLESFMPTYCDRLNELPQILETL